MLGKWEQWGEFTECTVSCGGGNKTRTRHCPSSPGGYVECQGKDTETKDCNTRICIGLFIVSHEFLFNQGLESMRVYLI